MKTNPKQTGSNSGRVLQDHLKSGSTFFPPFTYTASGPRWNLIKWRADYLPELVWLAQLVNDFGYDKANELACALAVTTQTAVTTSGDFGTVTGYSILTQDLKSSICKQLQKSGVLDQITNSLAPLLLLYPACPLSFLLAGKSSNISKKEAAEKLAPVIAQCLFRSEKLPMLAQGVYYNTLIATGRMTYAEGLQPLDVNALKDYPNTPESQNVGGFVRANATGLANRRISDEWPNRLLKNDFFGIFYSKNPMIMRVIFQKHGFFNSLLNTFGGTALKLGRATWRSSTITISTTCRKIFSVTL